MSKRKGSRSEYKTIRLAESQGYRCTKAVGSLGVWDIIAISQHGVALIQVKSNRWPGTAEMEAMRAFPVPPGVKKFVHRWDDYAREPQVKEIFG